MVAEPHVQIEGLTLSYGPRAVVKNVTLSAPRNGILGIVGPAGSGKSSMLTCLNRTIELTPGASYTGTVRLDGQDVRSLEASDLRRRVAMVLPLPVGMPMQVPLSVNLNVLLFFVCEVEAVMLIG